jgi:hypothetical protein
LSLWNEYRSESMEFVERQKKLPTFEELKKWFADVRMNMETALQEQLERILREYLQPSVQRIA